MTAAAHARNILGPMPSKPRFVTFTMSKHTASVVHLTRTRFFFVRVGMLSAQPKTEIFDDTKSYSLQHQTDLQTIKYPPSLVVVQSCRS